MLSTQASKVFGMDTGHIIAAGESYDISYLWRDAWNWVDDSSEVLVSLFVTDDNTIGVRERTWFRICPDGSPKTIPGKRSYARAFIKQLWRTRLQELNDFGAYANYIRRRPFLCLQTHKNQISLDKVAIVNYLSCF